MDNFKKNPNIVQSSSIAVPELSYQYYENWKLQSEDNIINQRSRFEREITTQKNMVSRFLETNTSSYIYLEVHLSDLLYYMIAGIQLGYITIVSQFQ